MTYYKVVLQKSDIRFTSCIATDDRLSTEYILNKWTFPRIEGSKLFIFKDLQSAQRFIQKLDWKYYTCRILECEAQGVVKNAPMISYTIFNSDSLVNKIKNIWTRYKNKKKWTHLVERSYSFPYGTLWADSVKLTKLVQ